MARFIDELDPAPDPRDWTRTPIRILGVELSACDCAHCWADLVAETLAGILFLGLMAVLLYLFAAAMGAPA